MQGVCKVKFNQPPICILLTLAECIQGLQHHCPLSAFWATTTWIERSCSIPCLDSFRFIGILLMNLRRISSIAIGPELLLFFCGLGTCPYPFCYLKCHCVDENLFRESGSFEEMGLSMYFHTLGSGHSPTQGKGGWEGMVPKLWSNRIKKKLKVRRGAHTEVVADLPNRSEHLTGADSCPDGEWG